MWFSGLLEFACRVVDYVARGIDCWKDWLTIDQHLNSWLLCAKEPKIDLIQSRSNSKHHRLVLIPQEVFRARVDSLDFPWNSKSILEFAWLPEPSSWTVFSAKCFVDAVLFLKSLAQLCLSDHYFVHLFMDLVKSLVYLFCVWLHVEQSTDVLYVWLALELFENVLNSLFVSCVKLYEF